MSASDAAIAQGMATRHKRSLKVIVAGIGEINALLAKMMKPGKIKWNGFGTHFTWNVRKLKEESSWNSGQLGTRSFEEKDPMDEATLPFCYTDETYGVGEKSIKSNRAAGDNKIYDIQMENARNAQSALYRAFVSALYSDGSDAQVPVGLTAIIGDAYEDTDNITTAAGYSYGGIEVAASAMTAWNKLYSTAGFTNEYWFPVLIDQAEIPGGPATPLWSTHAVYHLAWMTKQMSRTADVSGTGKIIKPDMALMGTDPFTSLVNLMAISQKNVAGVPVGTKDPSLADFTTIRVAGLDCVYDENVPDDTNDVERVIVLDAKTFRIESQNTKTEGLIEGKWKADDPSVVGGVGMYKSNWGLLCETPQAVGCITGCNG